MNMILEYLSRLLSQWKFWIIVPAWDIGVRTRLGKTTKKLLPGAHFRVPLLDEIILVNTRQRVTSTACVTLRGSRPGYAHVKAASIGYRIVDPVRAVMRYSSMDGTIICLAQAELTTTSEARLIEERLRQEMGEHGVDVDFVRLVEDVEVRTIRMLNDSWRPSNGYTETTTPAVSRF